MDNLIKNIKIPDLSVRLFIFTFLVASILSSLSFAQTNKDFGFFADVEGDKKVRVTGPGIVNFFPPAKPPFRERPGYFFVADNSGIRENGITFTIPMDTQSGTYEIISAHPLDVGKYFEVRAEIGSTVDYFSKNTKGTITVESLPDGPEIPSGYRIKGVFDFTTENSKGESIKVKGSFDFLVP